MDFEILKNEIRPPDNDSTTWIFPVKDGQHIRRMKIDAFDLNEVFRRAVGREIQCVPSIEYKLPDILANWDRFEQGLRVHFIGRD
jgi:hypothetical protein